MLPSRIPQQLYFGDTAITNPNDLAIARVSGEITDPLLSINTAGSNLLLRLLQIDYIRSLIRDALFAPTTDDRELYVAERKVVKEAEDLWETGPALSKEGWSLIIQHWELFVGSGKLRGEWSDLIFCDQTRTKWVLIDFVPFTPFEMHSYRHDIEMVLKRQALRFLALTKYLPIPDVKWIHATSTSLITPTLQSEIFSPIETTSFNFSVSSSLPRILNLTCKDLKPCITPDELRKIDGFLHLVKKEPKASSKSQVQLDEDKPDPSPLNYRSCDCERWFSRPARQRCMNCEVSKLVTELNICTGCWSILYCSQACQREHYPTHKRLCAKKEKKKQ